MWLQRIQSRARRTFMAMIVLGSLAVQAPSRSLGADDPATPNRDDADLNTSLPISKVIKFSVEDGNLATRTVLKPTSYMRAIDVADLPGTTRVDVRMRSRRDRPMMSLYFRLNHTEKGEADGDSIHTTLYTRPGYIEITRVVQTGDNVLTTTLTQMPENPPSGGENDDDIVLKVRRLDTQTSRVVEELSFNGASLVDLLRKHPRESAEFIAPIFRTFHQEQAVMAVELQSAWQVLADSMKVDESLRPAVERVVVRLGSADFRSREAAVTDLQKLGGRAALLLLRWPRQNLSAEQISKIEFFLSEYAPLTADQAARRLKDPDFLLTCVAYADDPSLRIAAVMKLPAELQPEGKRAAELTDSEKRILQVVKIRKTLPPREDSSDPQ